MSVLRILVTRPRHQSEPLARHLVALGHRPVILPLIEIAPPEDAAALDRALEREYDWTIFTSANAVTTVLDRAPGCLKTRRIAAVGMATATVLADRGLAADYVPMEFRGEAVAEGIGEVAGKSVLLPRSDIAREELGKVLTARGADVHEVIAYRTVPARVSSEELRKIFERGIDVVTFFSPSAVRAFVSALGTFRPKVLIACVGPITATAAREAGLAVDVVAEESTAPGLVEAISRRAGATV